jgi:hypothetical protein
MKVFIQKKSIPGGDKAPYLRLLLGMVILLFSAFPSGSAAQETGGFKSLMIDSLDNSVDISEFLRTKYGFVFVPTIITEPAIGYGGGGGLIFIHRDPQEIKQGKGLYPSLSGVGGFYTESSSWAVGGGHFGVWKNGHIRYRGGAGAVSANLSYYREPLLPSGPERLNFNIKAFGLIQEIIFRLGESDFLAGASYGYARTRVEFDVPVDLPEISDKDFETDIGGLGAVLYYDTRDNMFTPNSGIYAGIKYLYYDDFLGSDRKFQRLFSHMLIYSRIVKGLYGGLRLDVQSSFEDTPFYLLPFISLRGVPAMRYQGKTTYLAETEFRWDFTARWSLTAFTGYGEALPVREELFRKQRAYNFGAGFRYLVARLYGMRMGVDVARGPEDWAFYLQFGSSWFRY